MEILMNKIKSFRDLEVWSAAMSLAVQCYRATESFPQPERYGLTAQIRRAAASIPANLAEGHNRSRNAFRNHVRIAVGSQAELDTLLELGVRLKYLTSNEQVMLEEPLRKTGQMLHGLARALNRPLGEEGAEP
jgi:four helix bundle protein